jgi:hypothetical protein
MTLAIILGLVILGGSIAWALRPRGWKVRGEHPAYFKPLGGVPFTTWPKK